MYIMNTLHSKDYSSRYKFRHPKTIFLMKNLRPRKILYIHISFFFFFFSVSAH